MLVMTRDRERFARALGRIALDGHRIEGVVPADENVDASWSTESENISTSARLMTRSCSTWKS